MPHDSVRLYSFTLMERKKILMGGTSASRTRRHEEGSFTPSSIHSAEKSSFQYFPDWITHRHLSSGVNIWDRRKYVSTFNLLHVLNVFLQGFQPETRAQIPWDALLYIYASLFIPVLLSLFVGLNILVWKESRINYGFIFGRLTYFLPSASPDSRQ